VADWDDTVGFGWSERQILEDIVQGAELEHVLTAAIRLVERQSPELMGSVLLLDSRTGTMRCAAAPTLPVTWVEHIDGFVVGDGIGSCGTAAFLGETVIVTDIATHPFWASHRDAALAHDLRACWSSPIKSPEGAVLGTFAIYYRSARGPTATEREWVSRASDLCALALMRSESLRSLRESNDRARQLARLYAVSTSVNEAIARERQPAKLYELACRIPVEQGFARLAWVGEYDRRSRRVRPLARFGKAARYVDDIVVDLGDEMHREGPAARALAEGVPAVSNDICSDPGFESWRDRALAHGLRSCAAFPLEIPDHAPTVLLIYGGTPDFFQGEEVRVLAALSEDIAFALRSAAAEKERQALLEALSRRVRELSSVHGLSRLLQAERPMDRTLWEEAVELLASPWRNPARCVARITWHDIEVRTPGWRETDWHLAEVFGVPGKEGCIEVGYVGHTRLDGDPFTREDRELVHSFADILTSHLSRVYAEDAKRQNERLLQIAGQAAKLGAWVLDLSTGRFQYSTEALALCGFAPDAEPTLEDSMVRFHPDDRETLREAVDRCAREGVPYEVELERLSDGDAPPVWIRALGRPERDAHGTIVRVQGAVQDVTERRKLEDQLRQSQKMEAIGKLAGGVAHDFNNLLTVIVSYTRLALDEVPVSEPLHADLQEIDAAGQRATELTKQLLAFSRRQVLEPRVVNVSDVVDGLRKMMGRIVGGDIKLDCLTSEVGQVFADPVQLEQIVLNLLVNARDAMPQGGTVTLETKNLDLSKKRPTVMHDMPAGRYVMLSVADDGVGMTPATRDQIFEPFFTTKGPREGTGLGLSTVWGIVTQSEGYIAVESEPDVGTTFRIYFPRVDTMPTPAASSSAPPARLGGAETILLVEDDEQVRNVLSIVLQRAGYQVLATENAGEAFLVCESHEGAIDLLVTDLVMPRMNGRELAARLRKLRPDLRVLLVSGLPDAALEDDDAAMDFLAKPLVPTKLLRKLRELLDAETN